MSLRHLNRQPVSGRKLARIAVTAIVLLQLLGACSDDELPTVWVAKIQPRSAAPTTVVRIFGRGLEARTTTEADVVDGDTSVPSTETETCPTPNGLNAVTVGGVNAAVCFRSDSRIDLVVPRLPAGAQHVVVFSGGLASNAEVLYLLELTAAP
ncbi:MAG: hypothetical protein ACI9OJ_003436 [Myxococcota bacterium]|jgi:uncharacterized protein (TIGR03437 family)